jgi:LysM repeat protein
MPSRGSRQQLARYAAPAAFLLAVTVLVLLIRSGLGGSGGSAAPPATTAQTITRTHTTQTATTLPAVTAVQPVTTTAQTVTAGTTSVPGATYYTVQKGDTFGVIATKSNTTVAAIEQLNPGVNSNALQVGQQIRVK